MNASVNVERNSWRLPPDETVQVADPRSKSAQDLTYGDGGHNWRSIIFSLLVIGFVIAGIVTAIYLLGYVDELLYWSGRRLTLDECLRDDLTPHRLPPTWLSHEKFVYQADDGSLTLLTTGDNTVTILVSNHTLVRIHTCMPVCSLRLNCINDKLADDTRDALDAANLAKAQTVKPGLGRACRGKTRITEMTNFGTDPTRYKI